MLIFLDGGLVDMDPKDAMGANNYFPFACA